MKIKYLLLSMLYFVMNANCQSVSFQTYMNPVIPGDHPDCTLTQIGDDFYTTGSSFNVIPTIYHSTDLVHWEAVSHPVSPTWEGFGDYAGAGCWGGQVVYHFDKWWHFFARRYTPDSAQMFFTTAESPEGPWTDPVSIIDPDELPFGLGYDNSIFIDDDGKLYLLAKFGQPNGAIVEIGSDGQATGVVYNLAWLNPAPAYFYSWAEGPVMWKYNGYYYYSFARDLAGGQKVMRSEILTADSASWEMLGDFFNESDPLKGTSQFTSPNHASQAVLISDSTSWVVHPLYAKGEWIGQGRQGLLNQVRYDENDKPVADYPIDSYFEAPKLPSSGIPWMVPKSDFFDATELNPEWSFLGYTPANMSSLTDRPGWLRLSPKNDTLRNTVTKNDAEHNYSMVTRVDFSPATAGDEAGIWMVRGDETMEVKLVNTLSEDGIKEIMFSFRDKVFTLPNEIGDTLWFKIVRINHKVNGYYSAEGTEWNRIGEEINIAVVDAFSDFVTFTGTRQGLYVKGTKDAYFDFYIYRDAYTPIMAECPANQFGTKRGSYHEGIKPLKNIHNNDWALYAGVEFGNGDYFELPDSVAFTASCEGAGGTIEVWLDSIGTGTKIADCAITTTSALDNYQIFKAKIDEVSGIHDVYLKFIGTGEEELFQLKWITFLSKSDIITITSINDIENQFKIYPNPANDELTINSEFQFTTLEIIDMSGRVVKKDNFNTGKQNHKLVLNFKKGIYIVRISDGDKSAVTKLFVE